MTVQALRSAVSFRNIASSLVWALLGAFIVGGWYVYDQAQPPLVLKSLQEDDGIAFHGGMIDLVVTIDRTKLCPTTATRFLWRWTEFGGHRIQQFVPLETSGTPGLSIGHDQFMLSLPVPAALDPGQWFFRGISVDSCPWLPRPFRPTPRQTPDVPVSIPAQGRPQ